MTPEQQMAQDVLNFLGEDPSRHDQRSYSTESHCGTTYCVAGAVGHLSGLKYKYSASPFGIVGVQYARTMEIEGFAAKKLGLGSEDAHDLFYEMDNQAALNKLKELTGL